MIDEEEAEDLEVSKVTPPEISKFNDTNFLEALSKEMMSGKIWRTSKGLAEKLKVDVKDMDSFLTKQSSVCSRPAKEEGVYYYALIKRITEEKPEEKPIKIENIRPITSEEHRYALACLHSALILYHTTLEKYALKLNEKNSDAFTMLVAGKDRLEAGISLLATTMKVDLSKLPKV